MDTAIPKRQRIKQQNRQFILDAARRVFADRGYGAATIRDIIRAVKGVSRTAITPVGAATSPAQVAV